jgi:DNA modification methylase
LKPYYEHGGITIYHGDCREVSLPSDAAVVSDPPYGINFNFQTKRSRKSGLDFGKNNGVKIDRDPLWKNVHGDDSAFNPEIWLRFGEVILWGANNYSSRLPDSRGWLVWNKLGDKKPCAFGDCELAWTSFDKSIRIHNQLWRGLVREGEDNAANGPKWHPCQKPIELMRWCVGFTTKETIIDPYMGSGTTLRAAKDHNRKAIGVEIEESYCEIAATRLEQEVLAL